ncbi:hypothetical protein RYR30_001932 [Flavobacterium psychrophilum]|nr:hypothetical protein [Flavobacterium psychrophilum]ELM3671971.1 hypothetical protein [Flavobacterium psychrophilum]ELM3726126.1 hypothetical protein [Flavobacterium psychrophilum]
MELILTRTQKTDSSTIGELSVNGKFECYILEDVERDVKVKGKTAIPKGRYEIAITYSNRFKKMLPLLLNVPNYEGIRIHTGNTASDTEGCLITGKNKGENVVSNSRLAFEPLYSKLSLAVTKEKVFITIK